MCFPGFAESIASYRFCAFEHLFLGIGCSQAAGANSGVWLQGLEALIGDCVSYGLDATSKRISSRSGPSVSSRPHPARECLRRWAYWLVMGKFIGGFEAFIRSRGLLSMSGRCFCPQRSILPDQAGAFLAPGYGVSLMLN